MIGVACIVDATRSSIVAYYDAMPAALGEVIRRVQGRAAEFLGAGFTPRPMAEVHATVIGLESSGDRRFDVGPLAGHLVRELADNPLEIRFGGFATDSGQLTSRDAPLHDRTFLVRGGNVVLVGWPVLGGAASPVLADIRRGCEPFGVVHRYHRQPGASDPDVYLVVGRAATGETEALEAAVRRELGGAGVRVPMGPDDLGLVEYAETTLPLASTRLRPLRSVAGDPM